MVKYDPEFIAAKRKKAKGLSEKILDDFAEPPSDMTWQQLIQRHDPTNYSENLWACQFSWFSHLNISLPLAEHVIHMFVTFLLHLKRDPFSLSNKR